MPYIGKEPIVGNFQVCDAISVVNGQAAYTMQVGGSNVEPESANHMLVSLNGVLQKPGSSFTISGSTITFASNLATGDVIDFITLLGDTLNTGAPSDDTVTAAKLNNDIISGQTALTSAPDDTDEFLVSDAGTLKRIDYSLIKGGGITVAQQWRVTSNFNETSGVNDVTANWEAVDSDSYGVLGSAMSESSGIFTFPSTGIYHITFQASTFMDGGSRDYFGVLIFTTTDNSNYNEAALGYDSAHTGNAYSNATTSFIFDVTNTSTHKVKFKVQVPNSINFEGNTDSNKTFATFIRLGDT